MSNITCKFYQQGTCRFGSNCKFSHGTTTTTTTTTSGATFSRFSEPNRFNYLNPAEKIKQKHGSPESFAETILTDFKAWIASKIWPFSCYSIPSFQDLFPDLKDISFEEARMAYLSAQASGSLQNHLQELTANGLTVHNFIENVAKTDKNTLINMLKSKMNGDSQVNSNTFDNNKNGVFSSNSSSSTFGKTNVFPNSTSTVANPFAANPNSTSSSAFGLKPATFGSSSTTGTGFGSSTTGTGFGNATSSGLFGVQNTVSNSVFGSSSTTFGQQPAAQPGSFLSPANTAAQPGSFLNPANTASTFAQPAFGGTFPTSQPTSNPFASSQKSAFGSSAVQPSSTGSVFGSNTTNPTTNAFATTTSNQPTGFGATQPNTFGSAGAGSSAFGSAQNATFGVQSGGGFSTNQTTNSAPASNTTSVFGSHTTNTQPNAFSAQPTATSQLAAPQTAANPFATNTTTSVQIVVEDNMEWIPMFTDEDLVQCKNQTFELGKIPECPPPPELCV